MYLQTASLDTTVTVCLLTAKSKLAPIKKQTIPRLELRGAQVLSKLLFQSAKDLDIPMNSVCAWSDSAVVLGWMKTSPGKLKSYVFHRVQDTIKRIPFSNWRYVNTIHNPAVLVSRGVSPKELLKNKLWWESPPWLSQLPAWWPRRPDINRETALLELKPSVSTSACASEEYGYNFSSYIKLCHVTASIQRFLNRIE